jgi:hypothetical protein
MHKWDFRCSVAIFAKPLKTCSPRYGGMTVTSTKKNVAKLGEAYITNKSQNGFLAKFSDFPLWPVNGRVSQDFRYPIFLHINHLCLSSKNVLFLYSWRRFFLSCMLFRVKKIWIFSECFGWDQVKLLDEELKAKGFSMKFCSQKRFAPLLTFLVELFL